MNDLLELKGELISEKFRNPYVLSLSTKKKITTSKLKSLEADLIRLEKYWKKNKILPGILVSVYYNRAIPKSARIDKFFSNKNEASNEHVKGVRFNNADDKHHIITYYLEKSILVKSMDRLRLLIEILGNEFDNELDSNKFESIKRNNKFLKKYKINASTLKRLFLDMVDIDKFDTYYNTDITHDDSMYITLFDTGIDIHDLMNKLNIKNTEYKVFSNDTIYCDNKTILKKIMTTAPYLVSMTTRDFATYNSEQSNIINHSEDFTNTPDPQNEPTIGVIDTHFNKNAYFSNWVEYHNCMDKSIPIDDEDYWHGTCVDSIIVDGARINPKWDDGCGMFKVRHFGVAKNGPNNSYDIINKIRQIVEANSDIHVWNISLGSQYEISENYISPEAAILDELQFKNNVVFVVSGTNANNKGVLRIGAPADSINGITVNAVNSKREAASYSRRGKVLSFFIKPDICAFGGDSNEKINVCSPVGLAYEMGTSFAAPWISRKMCFLIDKIGLSREIAKALIIDSAIGWKKSNLDEETLGHGVVPTKIEDVMMGKRDEIKFFIEGVSKSYNTYTYNLPVPVVKDKFPFYARAVLCYYPECTRSQGVDYTNTELDLHFGRVRKGKIESINKNLQGEEYKKAIDESTARELFRKWDNIKIVNEVIMNRKIPRKTYEGSNMWGLEIKNKDRVERERGLKFGVVITLREMNGVNRNREFIDQCVMHKWIVNKVNINAMLNINAIADQEIHLDS